METCQNENPIVVWLGSHFEMRIEVINIFLSFGLLSDSIIVIQIVFMAPTMLDLSIYLLIYGRPQNQKIWL